MGSSLDEQIAYRYAKCFFELASEKSRLEESSRDLSAILTSIQDNLKLKSFIENQEISPVKQNKIIRAIWKQTLTPETVKFLNFLVCKNRLDCLEQICIIFNQLYSNHKDLCPGLITTSTPLAKKQLQDIEKTLSQKYGQTIQLESKINKELLAGCLIQIKDKVLDLTVKNRLQQFHNRILNA